MTGTKSIKKLNDTGSDASKEEFPRALSEEDVVVEDTFEQQKSAKNVLESIIASTERLPNEVKSVKKETSEQKIES